jgi:uncharacterized protein (DUF697 family)
MAKRRRPSFDTGASSAARGATSETGWVYRSDEVGGVPAARVLTPEVITHSEHYEVGRAIVRKYAAGSAAASLIPLPLVDLASIATTQVMMVRALALAYGLPPEKTAARAAVAALAGTATSRWLARGVGRSLLKMIPGLGTIAGALAMPAFTSAATYAIGRAFIAHFEAGGSLETATTPAARARMRREMAGGPAIA